MKVQYRYAVIGWCPDLTDPDAPSLPAAILMVGTVGPTGFAATMGGGFFGGLDPLSAHVLRDVPLLVRKQVDEALRREPDLAPEALLYSLHNGLRNSLHVSAISEPAELEIADDDWLEQAVVDQLKKTFLAITADAYRQRPAGKRLPTTPRGLNPVQLWQLDRLRENQRIARA